MSARRAFAAGFASGALVGRGIGPEQAFFGRLTGWSIAGPDAAGWVTDFLNAAYYRRAVEDREVDDLRLALAVVTTYWWRREGGRRLHVGDVLPFHRTYGRLRLTGGLRSPRGTLNRGELLDGAALLLGEWFPEAYLDDARRGWGIAFPSREEKRGYRPAARMRFATVEELTPPVASGEEQGWHTYSPVEVASADKLIEALRKTEAWPDYASETGRFVPLRDSELDGQTFEVEVAAGTAAGRPVFQRGYVSATRVVDSDDASALRAYFDELGEGLSRYGDNEPRLMPDGGRPLFGIDLTTHKGHFMGRGRNRLVVFEHDGRSYVRAAGTWDPMPWHVRTIYRLAGRDAQHAFWGRGGTERQSMLYQLAQRAM